MEFAAAVVRAGFHKHVTPCPLLAALLDVRHMIDVEQGGYSGGEVLFQGQLIFGAVLVVMSVIVEGAVLSHSIYFACMFLLRVWSDRTLFRRWCVFGHGANNTHAGHRRGPRRVRGHPRPHRHHSVLPRQEVDAERHYATLL